MPELLIADDDEALRRWEERVVRDQGYSCDSAGDASTVREQLQKGSYKLALLDVNMPGESGIELLAHIRRSHSEVAVLMVTGEDSTELAMTAIEQGAYGYLIKPVAAGELLINVANALHRRRGEMQNHRLMQRLQESVDERDSKLEEALQDLELSETKVWVSQAETIFRLARIVEFRDEETGQHLHRMSSYCESLARLMGDDEQHCELVRRQAAARRRQGRGPRQHPAQARQAHAGGVRGHQGPRRDGGEILSGSASAVVQHGRADRPHPPRALGRQRLSARAWPARTYRCRDASRAVADVFDALTSDRVYRSALPVKSAVEMMREERGAHFDPEMLDRFLGAMPEIEAIRRAYAD